MAGNEPEETQMLHRTIRYAVRARLGRDEWMWSIYPEPGIVIDRAYSGSRQGAVEAACRAIDRWLTQNRLGKAR
jgi:hypothetical protein